MSIDLLLNPWVISGAIVIFLIGNLVSLRYLGKNGHLIHKKTKPEDDMDRLIKLYKEGPLSELKQGHIEPTGQDDGHKVGELDKENSEKKQ